MEDAPQQAQGKERGQRFVDLAWVAARPPKLDAPMRATNASLYNASGGRARGQRGARPGSGRDKGRAGAAGRRSAWRPGRFAGWAALARLLEQGFHACPPSRPSAAAPQPSAHRPPSGAMKKEVGRERTWYRRSAAPSMSRRTGKVRPYSRRVGLRQKAYSAARGSGRWWCCSLWPRSGRSRPGQTG